MSIFRILEFQWINKNETFLCSMNYDSVGIAIIHHPPFMTLLWAGFQPLKIKVVYYQFYPHYHPYITHRLSILSTAKRDIPIHNELRYISTISPGFMSDSTRIRIIFSNKSWRNTHDLDCAMASIAKCNRLTGGIICDNRHNLSYLKTKW